jgi:hypothetical protein
MYVLVGVGLKIALGIFYLRIAIERWQILLTKFIIIGSATFGIVCLFLVVFQCIPGRNIPLFYSFATSAVANTDQRIVSTFWTIYPANDQCIPKPAQNGITFALNAMNACTDWILGTLPFFMVRHLNLSFRTKMMVASLLAFAAVYVVFRSFFYHPQLTSLSGSTGTIVRMKYVKNLTNGPEFLCKSLLGTFHFIYLFFDSDVTIDISIWSTVEPGIGITAASIATLRPVLQALLWRLGFASQPPYIPTRPIGSSDERLNGQYRLDWLKPTHRAPRLAHIESSTKSATKPHHGV